MLKIVIIGCGGITASYAQRYTLYDQKIVEAIYASAASGVRRYI